MSRLLFFDVETPNRHNDRICGMGIICEEDGNVIFKKEYLINPEVDFDVINTKIHGISSFDVKDCYTFPDIWKDVKDFFSTSILVGHNIVFDLSVLEKTLNAYGLISEPKTVSYEDTLKKSKSCYCISGYKLNEVCDFLGIVLDKHHDALCDAEASMEIYDAIRKNKGWNNYDINMKCFYPNGYTRKKTIPVQKFSTETVAIRALKDILSKISEDNVISEEELYSLSIWIEQIGELKEKYPFDKIFSLSYEILRDGIITKEENEELLGFFNIITQPVAVKEYKCDISLDGKHCCLTGEFSNGNRADIQKILESRGAIIEKTVTKTLDYLIVGGIGSSSWAYGNYGSKVKKALEYIDHGIPISIISEKELFE